MRTSKVKTEVLIKAEKLAKLIENGLKGKTLPQKIQIIDKWIADKRDTLSPVSFLGEESYSNYLNYLIVNGFDELINNAKPFIPRQNYQQEWDRLIKFGGIDALLKQDELFQEFCHTIDCALQDRFFRKLDYVNPTTTKTEKLWQD